jgi:hypothetical protein
MQVRRSWNDGAGPNYLRWNDAIASRFFNEEHAEEPVYLFVTQAVLAEVGQQLGEGPDDFLAAVRAGPPGLTRPGHCQRALQVAEGWRDRDFPGLCLCLSIDRVARRATVSLRCYSKRELPADGLSLEGDSRGMLTCDAFLPEWSAPLEIAPDSALPSARGGTYCAQDA